MGITHVTVRVANLRKDQPSYEADFLVDTGAIDCLAPASVLKTAGIEIEGQDIYELANGEVVEYPSALRASASWAVKPLPISSSARKIASRFSAR